MTRARSIATNQAVLDALGIDGTYITALTLTMRDPGQLPKVEIESYLSIDHDAQRVTERFELVRMDEPNTPDQKPVVDLDVMVVAARKRLAVFITTKADELSNTVSQSFFPYPESRPARLVIGLEGLQ